MFVLFLEDFSSVRSFAFSSIQDQRAELEPERNRGGEELACRLLSIPPSTLHSSREGGGQCCSPKAKRRTERCDSFPSFDTCPFVLLPSSLQPRLVRVLFGLLLSFLVVFGFVFFWFAFIFGILLQKKVWRLLPSLKRVLPSACPSAPILPRGGWSKGSSP